VSTVKQELKDNLPQLKFRNLGQMDSGTVERRVDGAIRETLDNIGRYPFRDGGKVESRKVTITLVLTPALKKTKQMIELAGGRSQEVDTFELDGVSARVEVSSALPVAKTADVRVLCETRNGRIETALFNPHNNQMPEQMELFGGDDEDEDDSDEDE